MRLCKVSQSMPPSEHTQIAAINGPFRDITHLIYTRIKLPCALHDAFRYASFQAEAYRERLFWLKALQDAVLAISHQGRCIETKHSGPGGKVFFGDR